VTPGGFGGCVVTVNLDVTRTSAGKLGDVQDLTFLYWDGSEFFGFCESDTDCAEGDRCVVGVCDGGEEGDSCQNPRDCDSGLLCSSTGRCSLGEKPDRCGNDFDCQGDLYCASLQCQDGSRGDFCVGGAGQCDERLACAASADGAVGTCTGGGPFESCTADEQCVDPLVCDGAICAECLQPSECEPGATCIEAVCSETLASCTTGGDCAADEFCTFLEVSGGPPQQVCIGCVTAGDCPAGEICSAGKCVECVSNTDCTADPLRNICSTGSCVECVSSADCPGDLLCNGGVCDIFPAPD